MGASDSCLETSICPPAFIPDHSYEIKFNKNLFLRLQRNEIQPFLNIRTQWDRTAKETSCSTCISQVRHFVQSGIRETAYCYSFLWILLRLGVQKTTMLHFQGRALSSLFNLKARLLFCRKSEILFPGRVSCRLLVDETGLDSDCTGIRLGFQAIWGSWTFNINVDCVNNFILDNFPNNYSILKTAFPPSFGCFFPDTYLTKCASKSCI